MSAGEKLKSARKEKKLSIKKAASEIKVSPQKIKALEEENYSFFPSPFYARSFLKSYSRFLEVEIDPAEEIEDSSPPSRIAPQADVLQVPEKKKNPVFSKIIGIIILLAAIVYLALLYFPDMKPEKDISEIGIGEEEEGFVEIKSVIHQPTWVRVRGNGDLIYEGVLQPPATEYFMADEHINIRIGYTPGMDLYYRNRKDAEYGEVDIEQDSVGWVNELEFTKKFSK